MDMFMDKLAQKLTAQEMIKANMEADTEQLNKLKGQVKEYSECLEQVQKLTEAGIAKINEIETSVQSAGAQRNAEIISALERLEKKLAEEQGESGKNYAEDLAAWKKEYAEDLSQLKNLYAEGLTGLRNLYADELSGLKNMFADELAGLKLQQTDASQELEKLLAEKLDASGEHVHKECVKVYRNVQAAVIEENNKQTDNLTESLTEVIHSAVKGYSGKLKAILTISIISMILALGSAALHILQMMNITLF